MRGRLLPFKWALDGDGFALGLPEADRGPAGLGHRRAGGHSEPEKRFQQSVGKGCLVS